MLLFLAIACASPPPGVLLLVVDTMRADAMGEAPDGARAYTEARSASNSTAASTATLLTGEWPTAHGVQHHPLDGVREVIPLPTILEQYPSTAGSDHFVPLRWGMLDGADVVYSHPDLAAPCGGSPWMIDVVDDWDGQGLLYLHSVGPHSPWSPGAVSLAYHLQQPTPVPEIAAWHVAAYQDCAAIVREQVAAVLDALPPGALAIVTSDHGEALGEDGLHGHGTSLHDAQTHVPLWVLWDGVDPGADETPMGATAVAATVRAALSGDDGCDLRTGADRCDAPVSGMLVDGVWEERL